MDKKKLFNQYFQRLKKTALRGDAREESFYPSLSELLQQVATATGRTNIHITTLPRSTEAGNPDFPGYATARPAACLGRDSQPTPKEGMQMNQGNTGFLWICCTLKKLGADWALIKPCPERCARRTGSPPCSCRCAQAHALSRTPPSAFRRPGR